MFDEVNGAISLEEFRILCAHSTLLSPDTLQKIPLEGRLQAIVTIMSVIDALCPPDENNPHIPVSISDYAVELMALEGIVDSIDYTTVYVGAIVQACHYAIDTMMQDVRVTTALKNWSALSMDMRQSFLENFFAAYTRGFSEITDIPLKNPAIAFTTQSPLIDPITGSTGIANARNISASVDEKELRSHVVFNLAAKDNLDCAGSCIGTALHELTHDHGYQMAWLYAHEGKHAVDFLAEDAEIYYLIHKYQVAIPPRMGSMYENFYVERIANFAKQYLQEQLREKMGIEVKNSHIIHPHSPCPFV